MPIQYRQKTKLTRQLIKPRASCANTWREIPLGAHSEAALCRREQPSHIQYVPLGQNMTRSSPLPCVTQVTCNASVASSMQTAFVDPACCLWPSNFGTRTVANNVCNCWRLLHIIIARGVCIVLFRKVCARYAIDNCSCMVYSIPCPHGSCLHCRHLAVQMLHCSTLPHPFILLQYSTLRNCSRYLGSKAAHHFTRQIRDVI